MEVYCQNVGVGHGNRGSVCTYYVTGFHDDELPGLGSHIILEANSLQADVTILVKFLRSEDLGLDFVFDPT